MNTIYLFIFKLENFNFYFHTLTHVCIFLCVYIDFSMDHAKGKRNIYIYIYLGKKIKGDKGVLIEEI